MKRVRRITLLTLLLVVGSTTATAAEGEPASEGLYVDVSTQQRILLPDHEQNLVERDVDFNQSVSADTKVPEIDTRLDEVVDTYERVGATNGTVGMSKAGRGYEVGIHPLNRSLELAGSDNFHDGKLDVAHHQEYSGNSHNLTQMLVEGAEFLSRPATGPREDAAEDVWGAASEASSATPPVEYDVATRRLNFEVIATETASPQIVSSDDVQPSAHRPRESSERFRLDPPRATPTYALPQEPPGSGVSGPRGPSPEPSPSAVYIQLTPTSTLARTDVLVAAAASAAAAGIFIGIVLYSLHQSKNILQNPVRRSVYKAVQEKPGITVAELANRTGVTHQTVSYHLQFLKKGGYVTDHEEGNRRRHFPAGEGYNEESRTLVSLSEDRTTMTILALIDCSPWIIKKEVANTIGITRTAAAWHITKLETLGLVHSQREQGHCFLFTDREKLARLEEVVQKVHECANGAPTGASLFPLRAHRARERLPVVAESTGDPFTVGVGQKTPRMGLDVG